MTTFRIHFYDGERHPLDIEAEDAEAALTAAKARERVLVEALEEGRRAIGDHYAPNDCYATGPRTGDIYRDLVECPACSFISMYEAVTAKIRGSAARAALGQEVSHG